MATRTSTRHAAQKAKEAISAAPDTKRRGSVGTKRKGSTEKAPEPKREKKDIDRVSKEDGKREPEKTPKQKVEPEESESHQVIYYCLILTHRRQRRERAPGRSRAARKAHRRTAGGAKGGFQSRGR
jgi:hypothetical protein